MPISASQDGVTVKTRRNTAGTPKDSIRVWSGVITSDDLDAPYPISNNDLYRYHVLDSDVYIDNQTTDSPPVPTDLRGLRNVFTFGWKLYNMGTSRYRNSCQFGIERKQFQSITDWKWY